LALLIARLLLAVVFVAAGIAKLHDLPGSRRSVAAFGVPPRLANPLGTLLPAAELAVAGALIADPTAGWGALGALSLLLVFAVAVAWNIGRGRTPDCHCFGQLHSSPAGLSTVARNLALAAVAAVAAVELADPAPTVAIATVGVVALALAAPVARRLEGAPATTDADGLAIGVTAPGFRLPALQGLSVTLDSLRTPERPVLLVFSDPDCGPCITLAPRVAHWQREHGRELTIAVLESRRNGTGRADEHGRHNVLFQRDGEIADAYRAQGTPTAVLVGPDGAIASAAAGGVGEIEALVARHVDGLRPRSVTLQLEPAGPTENSGRNRRASGRPLIRRELLERGAAAWVVTSSLLSWPTGALGRVRSERPCPDEQHRCGEVCCGPEQDCINNRCRCTQSRFPDKCGKDCVDTRTDQIHCGGCYRPPPMDRASSRRWRRPGQATPCVSGEMCVDGRCVDGDGSFCEHVSGTVCCDGEETGLNFDDDNCGQCGSRCQSGTDPKCCSGTCVDRFHDPRNCGACGKRCHDDEVCSKGECKRRCRRGQKACGYRGGGEGCYDPDTERCCEGQIVGIQSSAEHCGSCGQPCRGPVFVCKNGHCVCAPGHEGCFFQP
jgi:uncharacterized membrane protein YphA (DoxX/SURF4 family)/thiol-disulfide isomerase/thioredoxin